MIISESGIYSIVSLNNEYRYIGSSINLKKRYNTHIRDLKCKRHHNIILQRLYDRNDSLFFSVIEECDKSKLLEREQFYMDKYNPEINLTKFAHSIMLGKHHSEETKKKIGTGNKGKKRTDEVKKRISLTCKNIVHKKRPELIYKYKGSGNPYAQPIIQYDKNGIFIKNWSCAREVYNELKISYQNICSVCRGKRKTASGFIWRYSN